jgi:hypothetical protein
LLLLWWASFSGAQEVTVTPQHRTEVDRASAIATRDHPTAVKGING